MSAEQEIYINSASVQITNRCNFRCGHCLQGDHRGDHDMTPNDMAAIMVKINNPFLEGVILFGGEPRVNPQLPAIAEVVGQFVHRSGRKLCTEAKRTIKEIEESEEERRKYLDHIPEQERQSLQKTGELSALSMKRALDFGEFKRRPVSISVFTNGFGMSSPEAVKEVVNKLWEYGVNEITVSLDKPHRDFANEHNIPIDYKTLERLMNIFLVDKIGAEIGITEGIFFSRGGNAEYVIPVGRARTFSWMQRVILAGKGGDEPAAYIASIKRQLDREFHDWPRIESQSHRCYCGPAKLRRRFKEIKHYTSSRQIVVTAMSIEPDLSVNPCGLSVLPAIGNLREKTTEEIYGTAAASELYRILDEEGPQGLARRLTCRSEEEIRKNFMDRTPCGLCEDLVRKYPLEVHQMLKEPEGIKPRSLASNKL